MYRGELFNSISHLVGSVLAVVGTAVLITLAAVYGPGGARRMTALAIYGAMLVVLYLSSTLYHSLRGKAKQVYVLMGWLVVVAFGPLRSVLPPAGIGWLIAGGLVYTSGLAFYALSKKVVHMHGVWHLCVLGGSACHFVVMLRWVAL